AGTAATKAAESVVSSSLSCSVPLYAAQNRTARGDPASDPSSLLVVRRRRSRRPAPLTPASPAPRPNAAARPSPHTPARAGPRPPTARATAPPHPPPAPPAAS